MNTVLSGLSLLGFMSKIWYPCFNRYLASFAVNISFTSFGMVFFSLLNRNKKQDKVCKNPSCFLFIIKLSLSITNTFLILSELV